jgi:hypothetical protein
MVHIWRENVQLRSMLKNKRLMDEVTRMLIAANGHDIEKQIMHIKRENIQLQSMLRNKRLMDVMRQWSSSNSGTGSRGSTRYPC